MLFLAHFFWYVFDGSHHTTTPLMVWSSSSLKSSSHRLMAFLLGSLIGAVLDSMWCFRVARAWSYNLSGFANKKKLSLPLQIHSRLSSEYKNKSPAAHLIQTLPFPSTRGWTIGTRCLTTEWTNWFLNFRFLWCHGYFKLWTCHQFNVSPIPSNLVFSQHDIAF